MAQAVQSVTGVKGRKRLIVIGGGITGLSAAYYAQKHCRERGIPLEITVIEASEGLGGKINTLRKEGFVIEKGPDSFLARKLPIIDLSRELGLEDEFTGTDPEAKKTYILRNNKLHAMPKGLVLGIPTQLKPFIKTGLISPAGKARAAMDLFIPARKDEGDESLGHFLERRLGKEVLNNIAEPLLAGIYAGDTYALSLQSTFPQFQATERKFGSLIKGMMLNKQAEKKQEGLPKAASGSVFLTYKNGLSTLVERLEESLKECDIRIGCTVAQVEKNDEGYSIHLTDGTLLEADKVIAALPSFVLAKLFPSVPEAAELNTINYVSVANVIMAFNRKDISTHLDGSGFLVPRKEGRFITACTWTSAKWLHTAPKGKELIRCYVGRSGEEDWVRLSDEEIVAKVRKDVKDLMGITAEPLFYEVTRLPRSMPQYPVGHLQQVKRLRERLSSHMPGVYITGSGFHGVGLPDCIRQGKEAVAALFS